MIVRIILAITIIMMAHGCTSIRAEYNGMDVIYSRLGSRDIKSIDFVATDASLTAKVRGIEDNEGVGQNLENLVRLLDAIK